MRNIYLLLVVAFLATTIGCSTETKEEQEKAALTELLKGLTKTNIEEYQDQNLKLDGISIPVYTEEGKQVKETELIILLMSGKYIPNVYIDDNESVKVFVLRTASQEEKEEMIERLARKNEKSPLARMAAKSFSVTDMKENEYSLEELKGKVIVMNFWFTNCKPCVTEMPDLNKIVDKYKDKEVVFLGFTPDKKEVLEVFLAKQEFKYQIIPDSKNVIKAYDIFAYPTSLVINKNSEIVFTSEGLSPTTLEELEAEIEASLILLEL